MKSLKKLIDEHPVKIVAFITVAAYSLIALSVYRMHTNGGFLFDYKPEKIKDYVPIEQTIYSNILNEELDFEYREK